MEMEWRGAGRRRIAYHIMWKNDTGNRTQQQNFLRVLLRYPLDKKINGKKGKFILLCYVILGKR
jgi:hypothetical protein